MGHHYESNVGTELQAIAEAGNMMAEGADAVQSYNFYIDFNFSSNETKLKIETKCNEFDAICVRKHNF